MINLIVSLVFILQFEWLVNKMIKRDEKRKKEEESNTRTSNTRIARIDARMSSQNNWKILRKVGIIFLYINAIIITLYFLRPEYVWTQVNALKARYSSRRAGLPLLTTPTFWSGV